MTSIAPQERYRRLDLLGRGGMGEVFLADDLVLRRKVAIKVVHRTALANPRAEKLLRREAKAAAALDNPFICKVYEVGEDQGRVFIAMEYIQGETLRQRMQRGGITIREAVSLAREIADGLEEASRQGIIHRDLKPSNIIITPQSHVKIMDFGLAKRLPGDESMDESSGTPDGTVVGTREYMSPEQLRGKPVEPSSDLFALGLILYEMLASQHPFKKSTTIDTQFAILNDATPELAERCSEAPDDLCELVERLLKKAAIDRPRIREVRERLADIADSARPEAKEKPLGTSGSVEAFVTRKPRVVLALGLVLVLAVLALALWVGLRPEPAMPQAKMATLVSWPSNEEQAALSPDSKNVTFISNRDGVRDIWLMDLSGGEPRRLTNAPGNLTAQTFSADGTEVAYALESDAQKLVQTIRIDGGPPTRSLSLPNETRIRRMVRWAETGVFMETQSLELVKLSLSSGELTTVPTLPRISARPSGFEVSRDGQTLAFGAANPDGSTSVWIQDGQTPARPITRGGFLDGSPFYSDAAGQGRLFFESNRSGQEDLWLMDKPGREPRQITFGSNREFIESVSPDGSTIIFSEVLEGASIFSFNLRTGARAQLTAENRRDITPSLSGNGRLVFARVSLASSFPWSLSSILFGAVEDSHPLDSRILLREGFNPILSPDGHWLAYFLMQGSPPGPHLHLLNVNTGHSRELAETPIGSRTFMDFPWYFVRGDLHWSTANELFFVQGPQKEGSRILAIDPQRDSEPRKVMELKPGEMASSLITSADGSHLFYVRSGVFKAGGTVREIAPDGRETERYSAAAGVLSILGLAGSTLIVAEEPRRGDPRVLIKSIEGGSVRTRLELEAIPLSLRFLPSMNSLVFSRRDSREVENMFVKRLDTSTETMVTANGIQGVSFSPVSSQGSMLVFSQQLRNKDLGIIRLDRP